MISVCLTTYNSSRYIIEQLQSITLQLSENDEIIVSDDGSSDDTLDLIAELRDSRIKIISNEGPHGYTRNFENALKHAVGDYIFLSDHDDVWMPDKVSVCMNVLQDYDFVASDAVVTDSNLNVIAPSYFKQRVVYKSWIGNMYRFRYLGCLQAFSRRVLDKALPFPRNQGYCTHDNWLFMVARTYYRVKVLDIPLIYYRRHEGNASGGGKDEHKSLLFRITYRLYLLRHLIGRLFHTHGEDFNYNNYIQ